MAEEDPEVKVSLDLTGHGYIPRRPSRVHSPGDQALLDACAAVGIPIRGGFQPAE